MRAVWLLSLTAAVAIGLVAVSSAAASISGPCKAGIAGVDVGPLSSTSAGDAIRVGKNDVVPVTMSSASGISHLKIVLSLAGFHWVVRDAPTNGSSWSRSVNVNDYARWGVGLYQLTGESAGASACSGTALIRIGGNPLTTIAGGAGLGLGVVGLIGLLGTVRMAGLHPRRATSIGLLSGLVLSLGAGTLLQQYSVVFPTGTIALVTVLSGAAFGVVVPNVVHLIGHGGMHGHRPVHG